LSVFARLGSGSACRSILGGFVEWHSNTESDKSFATRFKFSEESWWIENLVILICVVEPEQG